MNAERYLENNEIVNLGIGIPTLISNYISDSKNIFLHSENGILGVSQIAEGKEIDANIVNAGKIPVTVNEGVSFFSSADSFSMIRGGHIDVAVIGALQVDSEGKIANWSIPGKSVLGVGGAMDLLEGAKKVIIAITHTTKEGLPKIVNELNYPLTSLRSVDIIVTELAVFKVENNKLALIEILPNASLEEIRENTQADFKVSL